MIGRTVLTRLEALAIAPYWASSYLAKVESTRIALTSDA
jgi:hypothetical protein